LQKQENLIDETRVYDFARIHALVDQAQSLIPRDLAPHINPETNHAQWGVYKIKVNL
jgi:hypothetical protein